jgi:hypothetical protein
MFQAERAREDSRASPAGGIRVHDEFFFSAMPYRGECFEMRQKSWGDLPDLNRHLRIHIPLCCLYTKISVELAVQAGLEPARLAVTARRSPD